MTPQCWEVAKVIFVTSMPSQMVISQLLVDTIEWNKCHFVANVIAFKMNIHLTSDYTSLFLGDENPIVCFFLTQSVCYPFYTDNRTKSKKTLQENKERNGWVTIADKTTESLGLGRFFDRTIFSPISIFSGSYTIFLVRGNVCVQEQLG